MIGLGGVVETLLNEINGNNKQMTENLQDKSMKYMEATGKHAEYLLKSESCQFDDRLTTIKRHFTELAMRACPLHLALRYKKELAQSSSVEGLRKIGVRLVEEICQ